MMKSSVLKRAKGWFRPGSTKSREPSSSQRLDSESPSSTSTPQPKWQDSVPPWEDWEVDDQFITKLNQWHKDHQHSTVSSVAKQIRDKLDVLGGIVGPDGIKDVLKLIPDAPFPAGTLIRCLVNVMLVGLMISEVKKMAYDFAIEVCEDISRMVEAFGKGTAPDDLVLQSWNDLKDMRNLVNEICRWAYKLVTQPVALESKVERTIQDFKERNERARNSFMALGTIRTLRGLAGMREKLDEVLESRATTERMEFIRTSLQNRVASNATYDQQNKDECHELTRDRWLKTFDDWLSTPSETERCWWITGQPGVGKSAIAMTAAECLEGQRPISAESKLTYIPSNTPKDRTKALYGQFFANYTIMETTNPDFVFPTIALQLANTSPAAAVIIYNVLKADRTVVNKLSENQVLALFVEPIRTIAAHEPGTVVTLFDGIDELANTDAASLSEFSTIFASMLRQLPPNVKILSFSRPETSILQRIASIPFIIRSDLLTEESKEDVRRFLSAELKKIAEVYQLSEWPNADQVELLNSCAAGHLGWASLAVRWIGREVDQKGDTKYTREKVFDAVKDVRKGNVYDLYKMILGRVIPEDAEEEQVAGCKSALGFLAAMHGPQNISTISSLLSVSESFDLLHFFRRISSIITSGLDAVTEAIEPRPHKSFIDYITSPHCDPRFRVDVPEHHLPLAITCLEVLLSSLRFNMADIANSDSAPQLSIYCPVNIVPPTIIPVEDSLSVSGDTLCASVRDAEQPLLYNTALVYACGAFLHHVWGCRDTDVKLKVMELCRKLIKTKFCFWLEMLVTAKLSPMYPEITATLRNVSMKFQTIEEVELEVLFEDAALIMDMFIDGFQFNVPHIYLSALPFSTSQLASHYRQFYPRLLSVEPKTEPPISPTPVPMAVMGDRFIGAVIGSSLLQVYDVEAEGKIVFSQPIEHPGLPETEWIIAISSNMIAAVYKDCKLWNFKTAKMGSVIKLPRDNTLMTAVAISPSDSQIIIGLQSGELYMYQLQTGEPVFQWLSDNYHASIVSIQYSQDGSRLVSGSNNGTICVWEATGTLIRSLTVQIENGVASSYAFCPSLGFGVGRTPSGTFFIDTERGETRYFDYAAICFLATIRPPHLSHRMKEIAISFDGRIRVDRHGGQALILSDTKDNRVLHCIAGHGDVITSVSFVGEGYRLMTASLDGTIRLWDLDSLMRGDRYEMDAWGIGLNIRGNGPKPGSLTCSYINGHWITGPGGECLFWQPKGLPFRNTRNTLVIGHCHELDMKYFVHGEEWTKCRDPIISDSE